MSLSTMLPSPFQVCPSPYLYNVLDLLSRSQSEDEPVAGYPVPMLCPHSNYVHYVILIQPFADLLLGVHVYVVSGLRGVGVRVCGVRVVIVWGCCVNLEGKVGGVVR